MKIISFLFFLGILSCRPSFISYEERIENCLSGSTNIPFDIVGSDKVGYSHTVPTSCIVGATLPEFKVTDIRGNVITTKNIKGKINILNFWFTACAPCVAEIPGLNKIKEKYQEDEVNYLSICQDNQIEVQNFLEKHPLQFNLIADGEYLTKKTFHSMWGYPLNIVTNKENIIIAAFSGGPSDETAPLVIFEKLDKYLSSQLDPG